MESPETPMPTVDDSAKDRDHKVAKGAGINILGNIGKLLFPLYWILVTRFFGPDVMGLFMLAFVSLEIIGNVTVSGFNDGVLMFASRALQGKPDEESLYRTLANGFVVEWARLPEAASSDTHDLFRLGWRCERSLSQDIRSKPLPYIGGGLGWAWDIARSSTDGGWCAEVLFGLSLRARGHGVKFVVGHLWAGPGSTRLDSVFLNVMVPFRSY